MKYLYCSVAIKFLVTFQCRRKEINIWGLPIVFLLIQYTVIKETYYSLTIIGGGGGSSHPSLPRFRRAGIQKLFNFFSPSLQRREILNKNVFNAQTMNHCLDCLWLKQKLRKDPFTFKDRTVFTNFYKTCVS